MKKIIMAPLMIATLACSGTRQSYVVLAEPNEPAATFLSCPALPPNGKARFIEALSRDIFSDVRSKKFTAGKKYSFSFSDMSVRDALLELSTAAKVPILFDDSVNSQVSIEIENKTFLNVLEILVYGGPYDYKYDGRSFMVTAVEGRNNDWEKVSYSYRYKSQHLAPSSITKMINPVYKSYITADDGMGVIFVTAPKRTIINIVSSIYELDRAPRQVMLKLSITEISDKTFDAYGRYSGNGTMFGAANGLAPIAPIFRSSVLNQESFSAFMAQVDMMNREGKADIRAQPKIIVMDGEKAKFESKTSHYFKNDLTSGRSGSGGRGLIETGLLLQLTPNIVADDEVLLNITDAKSGDFDVADNTKVNEHFVSTKVRVKQGDTLLLAGMIAKKKKIVTNKVPYLGDIPYLGWLFKSSSEEKADVEVVFSISPEIICPGK